MKLRELKNKFFRWLDGDYDVMANIMDGTGKEGPPGST